MDTVSQRTSPAQLDRNFVLIALCLIMVLAAALRFYQIDSPHLDADESLTVELANLEFGTLLEELQNGRPPVQIILLHFWMRLFGTSDLASRGLSAVIGVLSVPFVYLIGNRLFGRDVGLVSAILLALGFAHIFHSQEVRYYSVLAFMVLVAAHFYIRALDTGRRQDFALFTVFSILAVYTHYYAGLAVAAWGLHFILNINKHKQIILPWFISQIFIFVPSVAIVAVQYFSRVNLGREPLDWTAGGVVTPDLPFRTVLRFMINGGPFDDKLERAIILGVFFVLVAVFAFWKRGAWVAAVKELPGKFGSLLSDERSHFLFLILWLVIPLVVLYFTAVSGLTYRHRYVLGAAPALYLLMAVIIVRFRRVAPIVLSVMAVAAITFFGLREHYTEVQERAQWQEAAAYINASAAPDEGIYVPVLQRIFYWYYDDAAPRCYTNREIGDKGVVDITYAAQWDPTADYGSLSECNRVWLVLSTISPNSADYETYTAQEAILMDLLAEDGYERVDLNIEPLNQIDIMLYERTNEQSVTSSG